jgi:hypothetical protein
VLPSRANPEAGLLVNSESPWQIARRTMFRPTALLAVLASLVSTTWANCDCVGLDYTEGGSYLIDGYSDGLFSFTSVFEGTSTWNKVSCAGILIGTLGACFDASIIPILISPEGYGYLCSQIHSAEDGIEQVSTWYVFVACHPLVERN